MISKVFSAILCVILILGMLPSAALAAEEPSVEEALPEEIISAADPEDFQEPEVSEEAALPADEAEVEPDSSAVGEENLETQEELSAGEAEEWASADDVMPAAADEALEEAEVTPEADPAEETAASVEESGETEIAAMEAMAAAEVPDEETEPETAGEMPEEEQEEEAETEASDEEPADEAPVEEEGVYVDGMLMDPEDPLYARYALQLDGDSGEYYYTDFITRPLDDETLHYGIDVSAWQGTINWTKVANWGVEFAIIRCGYRTTRTGEIMQDGRFVDYINGAKAAGLKVGVYIFSQALTVKEAVEEADFMLNMVKGYDIDLPLVFDLEHYAGGRFSNAGLSAREITDMCLAFCERVEKAGYVSMVYANPSMLYNEIYEEELDKLWLAHYITETFYDEHVYEYWQCTSSGIIDGIEGRVDMDFWFQPNHPKKQNKPVSRDPFGDVTSGDWYYESVMQAYNAGVVKGVTDDAFQPQGTATRGQVVTMIHRLKGAPSYKKEAAFTDLTQTYYYDAISWAAEESVVTGTSDTTFHPDRAITRQELVTILYRMAGSPKTSMSLVEYKDAAKLPDWAADAMAWAVENKIITGYEDMTLHPASKASRAEVCAILMRFSALGA